MTKEELKEKLNIEEGIYQKKISDIKCDYAFSHNTVKIGDIIEGHLFTIKVDLIMWTEGHFGNKPPYCVYRGEALRKKDKLPYKDRRAEKVYQDRLLKINGKEVT